MGKMYQSEHNGFRTADRHACKDKLFIIIPAYNEEEMISSVIEQWHKVAVLAGEESRLVVIDDGSRDKTYEIMEKCQKKFPQLIALTKENEGHGATIRFGYEYAIEAGADYIFQTDSDGQTLPEEFPKFWRHRKRGAMIIGNRIHRQDGFGRLLVTKVLKGVLLAVFHVNVADANTPFRLIKADILKEQMHLIPEKYNLTNVLISVIFVKKKLGVEFLPITFRPRQGGTNSINLPRIIRLGGQALRDFYRLRGTI